MPAADTLAARLPALEDREAIRDLIARYGPAADSGDDSLALEVENLHAAYKVFVGRSSFVADIRARFESREAIQAPSVAVISRDDVAKTRS